MLQIATPLESGLIEHARPGSTQPSPSRRDRPCRTWGKPLLEELPCPMLSVPIVRPCSVRVRAVITSRGRKAGVPLVVFLPSSFGRAAIVVLTAEELALAFEQV